MKFITILLLSCVCVGAYAQQKQLNEILIKKDISKDVQKAEMKLHNGIPMYDYNINSLKNTGKVRCYAMENDALMRQRYPEMGSLDDFEKD